MQTPQDRQAVPRTTRPAVKTPCYALAVLVVCAGVMVQCGKKTKTTDHVDTAINTRLACDFDSVSPRRCLTLSISNRQLIASATCGSWAGSLASRPVIVRAMRLTLW